MLRGEDVKNFDNTEGSSRESFRQKVWEGVNNIYILPDLTSTNSVIFGVTTWASSASSPSQVRIQEYRRQSARLADCSAMEGLASQVNVCSTRRQ